MDVSTDPFTGFIKPFMFPDIIDCKETRDVCTQANDSRIEALKTLQLGIK